MDITMFWFTSWSQTLQFCRANLREDAFCSNPSSWQEYRLWRVQNICQMHFWAFLDRYRNLVAQSNCRMNVEFAWYLTVEWISWFRYKVPLLFPLTRCKYTHILLFSKTFWSRYCLLLDLGHSCWPSFVGAEHRLQAVLFCHFSFPNV